MLEPPEPLGPDEPKGPEPDHPARAPQPEVDAVVEAFPAQRMAAALFETPAPATDVEFSHACDEAAQWLRGRGVKPAKSGAWAKAWVTYSRLRDPTHISECWLSVSGAGVTHRR